MMNKKILTHVIILTAAALVCVAPSFAQVGTNDNRAGTAAAEQLLIPVGARTIAMGGGDVSGVSGIEAIYWNPAGLAGSGKGSEIMFSHLNYIADMNLNYIAASARFGNIGTFGFSLSTLDFGSGIAVTTETAPDGTGETFSPTFITVGLTFSRPMTDRINAGFNLKLVSEDIFEQTASTFGFDFGVQYATGGGFKLGALLKNIGPKMTFSGPKVERFVPLPGTEPGSRPRALEIPLQSAELPSSIEIGVAYDWQVAENNMVTFVGNFRNNNFTFDDYQIGAEYNFADVVFLRGGFVTQFNSEQDEFASNSVDNIYGLSLGAGVSWSLGENLSIKFDYAYRQAEFFDDPQWFSIVLGF